VIEEKMAKLEKYKKIGSETTIPEGVGLKSLTLNSRISNTKAGLEDIV
jgi:hypothetical protein